MSLTVGARFGPYEILAPLGVGGMGEVYRSRETKLNRDVAMLPNLTENDSGETEVLASPAWRQ
jgi:hypothetical protein